jgi:hypothetical protein
VRKFIKFSTVVLLLQGCTPSDPYGEGAHWDYRIHCENGFVYKHKHGMTIQVLNSDGTPLRCGKKIY